VPEPAATRRFVLLANPAAGRGDAERRAGALASRLRCAGAEAAVAWTLSDEDARARADRAAGAGAVVVAAGGDGLVGTVAGVVAEHGGVLGVLPAGRGNDFARALGVPLDDDEAVARVLLGEGERGVDLLDAGGRLVVGSIATGIDAAADARVHARRDRRLPAQAAYHLAALQSLATFRPPDYAVALDGGPELRVRAFTTVVANAPTYGAGLAIAPQAAVDDGLLDVVVLGALRRWRFPGLLAEVRRGAHADRPEVTVLRGRTATVAADRPLAARADGEALGELPLTVTVRPRALRVRAGGPERRTG